MLQHVRALSLAVAALCVAAVGEVGGYSAASAAPPASVVDVTSPIRHVVVIYQENHSFDDVLGDVCRARRMRCDGYTGPVTLADGVTAPNVDEPDVVPEVDHSPQSSALGLANQWDRVPGCRLAPYRCVTHYPASAIPNLAALANRYVVSDATFAAGGTASFGAHLNLTAGTMDGFFGSNPVTSVTGAVPHTGWGCNSNKDARWGDGGSQMVPTCIPDTDGTGPYRSSPVPNVPTLLQQIERAGLTWHTYIDAPTGRNVPSSGTWSVCTYFAWCLHNRFNLSYVSPRASFYTDAANGSLPNVTYMLPQQTYSQHNGASMAVGDNYIGSVVSAIQANPQLWESTAIFITYDDCGCFYDHVTPPRADLGLRSPMVIVSPYAKPGFTDSTVAKQPYSMLSFISHNFGLPPITPEVGAAYDYADSLDFTQAPLPGVPLTHTRISAREKARVARLSEKYGDDVT